MKKKNLNHNGLQLKKDTVSSLTSEQLKGGTNASIFRDRNGNCYVSVTGCPFFTIQPITCTCPPPSNNSCPGENCTQTAGC